jgi:redox-sensitive bicupin YhaK (pirin superfamily)
MDSFTEEMMLVPGMTHDLGGGFIIRRLLPFRKKRMVGPFIFLDHMGPVEFVPNSMSDIRPHPHIGLSTMTYLYEGRMVHRDNIGQIQTILPGEVNWMTAGQGIVHSERAHADDYGKKVRMQGLQFWVALPDANEDDAPSFRHYEKKVIPEFKGEGFQASIITGSAFGLTSPVQVSSPMIFSDLQTTRATEILFRPENKNFEIAIYVLSGKISYRSGTVEAGTLAILQSATEFNFRADANTHFIIIGGEAFTTARFIWWNFVSSSRDKIEVAKKRWKEERFPIVPGETERIPLGE